MQTSKKVLYVGGNLFQREEGWKREARGYDRPDRIAPDETFVYSHVQGDTRHSSPSIWVPVYARLIRKQESLDGVAQLSDDCELRLLKAGVMLL